MRYGRSNVLELTRLPYVETFAEWRTTEEQEVIHWDREKQLPFPSSFAKCDGEHSDFKLQFPMAFWFDLQLEILKKRNQMQITSDIHETAERNVSYEGCVTGKSLLLANQNP